MANSVKETEVIAKDNQAEKMENKDGGVSVDLPAPDGWKKKFAPKKSGTPKRNDIMFISPTGEEIKNKRQLDKFLKAHPGGPSAAEFDWTPGSTPRRSTRISEKSKAAESPENEPAQKRERKSGSKRGEKENSDAVAEETPKEAGEEVQGNADVEMNVADAVDVQVTSSEATPEGSEAKKAAKETNDTVAEETPKEEQTVVGVGEDVKQNTDVEMKEADGGDVINAENITAAEAMPAASEANVEEMTLERNSVTENPEVQEANVKNDSEAKESQTETITTPPEVTEQESYGAPAPAPIAGSNGEAANEEEAKVGKESSEKDVMVGDVGSSENITGSNGEAANEEEAKVGKESSEKDVMVGDVGNITKGEENLPDNNSNSKESQQEYKPQGTHSLNSEEAPPVGNAQF